jgi:hypothetical protein
MNLTRRFRPTCFTYLQLSFTSLAFDSVLCLNVSQSARYLRLYRPSLHLELLFANLPRTKDKTKTPLGNIDKVGFLSLVSCPHTSNVTKEVVNRESSPSVTRRTRVMVRTAPCPLAAKIAGYLRSPFELGREHGGSR